MYHDRPSLRFLVAFGSLGLAALLPGRESGLPVWLIVGSTLLPLVGFELGAALVDEARSPHVRAWGVRVQLVAALGFCALFCVALALQPFRTRGAWFVVTLALLGVLAAAIALHDYARMIRGRAPVASDPFDAGERIGLARSTELVHDRRATRVRLADALAVVGGVPILVGGIGLTGVLAVLFALVVLGRAISLEMATATAFFAGVALVAVAQGLERWETYVPSSRVRPLRRGTQLLSFLLFGGALSVVGWKMLHEPGQSRVKAWFMLGGGAFFIAGGIAYVANPALRFAKAGAYELVREGLLERSRAGWYLIPWAHVHSLGLGELQGMPALYVQLFDHAAIEPVYGDVAGVDRARKLERKRKSLRLSANLFGADIVILPTMTRQSVGDLYRKAASALEDDAVRSTLPPWQSLLAPPA